MEVIELSHNSFWISHLGHWSSLRYKDKVRDFDLKIFLTESEKSVFIPVNVDKDRPHDKRSFICLCHFSSCLAYRLQYKNLFKENCKENQVAFTLFKFRLQYTQYIVQKAFHRSGKIFVRKNLPRLTEPPIKQFEVFIADFNIRRSDETDMTWRRLLLKS